MGNLTFTKNILIFLLPVTIKKNIFKELRRMEKSEKADSLATSTRRLGSG